jgi:hypothetical protein
VDIVQHENQRPRPCEPLEELTDRAMAAIALVLGRDLSAVGEPSQRREDVRELCSNLVVEYGKPLRVQAPEILVQSIDEDGEGQVVLELRSRAVENEVAADVGATGQLPEKTRLAYPRFSHHLDGPRSASIEVVEKPLEHVELFGTSDEVLASQDHGPL